MNSRALKSEPQDWATPDWFIEGTLKVFHWSATSYDLDVAADKHNSVAKRYFDINTDGLKQPWRGLVWCNPPQKDVAAWVEKAISERENAIITMLVPARTETAYFQEILNSGASVYFLTPRIPFVRNNSIGSALVIFDTDGEREPLDIRSWRNNNE